ncbi:RDD family protein [Cryobacterium sp. CG_9.6]|uniref:RDD family protein n=1 Tax=Cryobacterium sp. CG_9.6 TaxID=2760710 RepID=UPI002476F5B0|nr:RDD family protein [Cryobacterium sp. CG_9.6]MDH6237038.1 putative RDD family membrane protein YckC [Cryobacterium sp. CG_9.6]
MATFDSSSRPSGPPAPSLWPGERLGLPRSGPGSVGRPGRRLAGVAIDWSLAVGVSVIFFDYSAVANSVIFVLLQLIFIPTIGGSIGHRLVGLRVVPVLGGWIGPWRAIVRSVLLVIVLPALVWDSDQRGFHDKVAGTVLLRA